MFAFNYFTPTRVVFGRDTEQKVAELIKTFGGTKVLIHYGGGSVVRSGLLKRVTDTLDAAGIAYVTLGGAVPNPRLSLVYQGIELCKKEGVDFLLAVGGGSAIDSAKAIGYGVTNEGDVWDFYDYKREAAACLPGGVYNFGSETDQSMFDITRDFLAVLGRDDRVKDCQPGHNLWMDCSKATKLGVIFSSVSDALKKCAMDYHLI